MLICGVLHKAQNELVTFEENSGIDAILKKCLTAFKIVGDSNSFKLVVILNEAEYEVKL